MPKFTAETTVRDVLGRFPEAVAVFLAHGMCRDCRSAPPPVPLERFAEKHGVALAQLVAELEVAAATVDEPRTT